MKRRHDQDNSDKRKHLIGGLLSVSEVSPLSSWQGAWWHNRMDGTEELAERFTYKAEKEILGLSWAFETSKPTSNNTFLQ